MKKINKYYKNSDQYKNKDFVIFGNGGFADLIYYYLKSDTPFFKNLKAFVISKEYIQEKNLNGLSVLEENNFIKNFEPKNTIIVMGIGYINLNKVREKIFLKYKNKGYNFFNYLSSNANIEINEFNFEGVSIFSSCIVQPYTKIGSNVIIRNNCNISHHCNIEDGVFLSNNVCTGGKVVIGKNSFIGLSTIIIDNTKIGINNFISAGSLVTTSTKNDGVYRGSPARYVCSSDKL